MPFKMVVTFTERLLRLGQDERRKEYRRQDFVALEKIPTWRQEHRCELGCSASTRALRQVLTPLSPGGRPVRMSSRTLLMDDRQSPQNGP